MAEQGTPNRFIEIPKFDKEVWDSVPAMHPKTLAVSILCQQIGKSDEKSMAYASLTDEVYDMAHSDATPLHGTQCITRGSSKSTYQIAKPFFCRDNAC